MTRTRRIHPFPLPFFAGALLVGLVLATMVLLKWQ